MKRMRAIVKLPRALLHLEGLAVLVLSLVFFTRSGSDWTRFAILFLAPDLSIVAFLGGKELGAAAYNVVHTYVVPIILILVGLAASSSLVTDVALIWLSHIGFDRAIGFGLRYPSSSLRRTHLQVVGEGP